MSLEDIAEGGQKSSQWPSNSCWLLSSLAGQNAANIVQMCKATQRPAGVFGSF